MFQTSVSRDLIQFVGYSFVDDTNLIQTSQTIHSMATKTLPCMQAALDLWNQVLSTTRGTLVPEKSFWYSIDFKWTSGRWKQYITQEMANKHLMMNDHQDQLQLQAKLLPSEARRTLGVYFAPNGNNQLQEQILLAKTWEWVENIKVAHLDWMVAWLNIMTTLIQQIYYTLPAMTLSPTQCKCIMQLCWRKGLAMAGYTRSFPRAILHAPYKYYGLNLTNMCTKQGIQHILAALQFGHSSNDLTRKLI